MINLETLMLRYCCSEITHKYLIRGTDQDKNPIFHLKIFYGGTMLSWPRNSISTFIIVNFIQQAILLTEQDGQLIQKYVENNIQIYAFFLKSLQMCQNLISQSKIKLMKRFLQLKINEGFLPIVQHNLMYRLLERNDINEAFNLIAQYFTTKEGLALSIGCSQQEYYEYFVSVQEDYLESQSSLVVVDISRQNMIVGVLLGQDFYKPSRCKPKLSSKLIKFAQFIQEYKYQTENILNDLNIQKQEGLVICASKATVHDDYIGQNIIRKMVQIQQHHARIMGFKYFITFVATPQLQKYYILQEENQQLINQEISEQMLKQKFQNIEVEYDKLQADFKDETPRFLVVMKYL